MVGVDVEVTTKFLRGRLQDTNSVLQSNSNAMLHVSTFKNKNPKTQERESSGSDLKVLNISKITGKNYSE